MRKRSKKVVIFKFPETLPSPGVSDTSQVLQKRWQNHSHLETTKAITIKTTKNINKTTKTSKNQ